uniref:Uncharacterized protein n=1 Tax=Arundo donax TaxID=35708 RepID=A0A0A9BT22_ARUDO
MLGSKYQNTSNWARLYRLKRAKYSYVNVNIKAFGTCISVPDVPDLNSMTRQIIQPLSLVLQHKTPSTVAYPARQASSQLPGGSQKFQRPVRIRAGCWAACSELSAPACGRTRSRGERMLARLQGAPRSLFGAILQWREPP